MKKIFILSITALFGLAACNKGLVKPSALTSFNITNAVVGGNTLTLNSVGANVPNNGNTQCTLFAGQTQIKLDDTSMHPPQVYFNQMLTTTSGSYYSLYLSGTSPAQVDNVLVKESYTNYTDSVAGVRFINLSPGSNPISVNIAGDANGSAANGLAYKGYTSFNKYSATVANSTYNFEFRDAASGNLLATYSLSTPVFKNVTLALAGLANNATVIAINEY